MKKYIRIPLLFVLCFSLYACPNAEGDKKETNTVDLALNETEANAEETEKQIE